MTLTIDDYLKRDPGPLAVSDWFSIDQDRVDAFAAVTGHTHWLHTDADRARRDGPQGGTVAHGFLILSLINRALDDCGLRPTDCAYALNCGVDHVRFLKPMPVKDGFRVRDRISLIEADMHERGLLTRTGHAFEIENAPANPVAVGEYVALWVPAE